MLEDLLFVGNPLEEKHTAENDWRKQVAQRMKGLKKLDGKFLAFNMLIYIIKNHKIIKKGEPVIREEEAEAD